MDRAGNRRSITRRAVLRASGGAAGIAGIGTTEADEGEERRALDDCRDATIEPSTGHCEGSTMEGCADDHPATASLRSAVRDSLDRNFPTVGALIDAGYVPYFDLLTSSHP